MTQPPPWHIDPELVSNQEDDKTAEKDQRMSLWKKKDPLPPPPTKPPMQDPPPPKKMSANDQQPGTIKMSRRRR